MILRNSRLNTGGAAAASPNGGESPSPGRENFVICGHSVFVGSLSDPTVWARGRGEGRVGGAERVVVRASG